MPKLVAEDVALFLSLLADLFPGVSPDQQSHPELEAQLPVSISKLALQPVAAWIKKISQVSNWSWLHRLLLSTHTGSIGSYSQLVQDGLVQSAWPIR